MQDKHDAAAQMWHAVPSLAAIGAWLFSVPLEKWVAVSGLAFLALQAAYLLWKWRRDYRRERERIAAKSVLPDADTCA